MNAEQIGNELQLSIYAKGKVSAECLAKNIVKLKMAFPKLPGGWYSILEEMLDDEQFSNDRLNDAVKNLIKVCQYPEPTVANLLSYDKKIKLYTYENLLSMSNELSVEGRKKFWDKYEIHDKERKIWKEK